MLFRIEGDDFWPYMARIMAGTVLAAGKKEIEPERVKEIIAGKDRAAAGDRLEARGLFLTDVVY